MTTTLAPPALHQVPHEQPVLSELRNLLRIKVPLDENLDRMASFLADMGAACLIDLQTDEGAMQRVACASNHPSLTVVAQLKGDFPVFASNRVTAGDALHGARAGIVPPVSDLATFLGVHHPEHKTQLASASVKGVLLAPILFFEQAIGIITVISLARAFDESDANVLADAALLAGTVIEHLRSQQRWKEAQVQARSGLYYKDAFLSTVSHELRTPLQAMLGWTHLMRDDHLTPHDKERALASLEESIKAQGKIVNDLLELSRINSGKLDLAAQPVELRAMLKQALRAFQTSASSRQIELAFEGATEAPVWINADPSWMQRAFWNLLSNAVKFTPNDGRVAIDLTLDSGLVRVCISDTGTGIEPQNLPHLFEAFSRTNQGTTRQHHGLGVGLAIVKHVVEAHGGMIEAKSEGRNKGTTFCVVLPVCAAPESSAHANGDTAPPNPSEDGARAGGNVNPALSGMKILLVEDESDTRELLRVALRHAGAEVADVSTAQDGLNAMRTQRFDTLICDIGMPHEDGFSLIRKIRALPANQGAATPALALTAYASREDRLNALRSGFQVHMPKPVDISELLLVVKSLVVQSTH